MGRIFFQKKGLKVVCIDALSGNGIDRLIRLSNQLYEEKKAKL